MKVFLLLLVCYIAEVDSVVTEVLSVGSEFLFPIPGIFRDSQCSMEVAVTVGREYGETDTLIGGQESLVTVSFGSNQIQQVVSSAQGAVFRIDLTFTSMAVHVTALGSPVSVTTTSQCYIAGSTKMMSEYLVLPMSSWGDEHIIVAPPNLTCHNYNIIILGPMSAPVQALIRFQLKNASRERHGYAFKEPDRLVKYVDGNAIKTEVMEAFELKVSDADPTGTAITCYSRCAVFIGHFRDNSDSTAAMTTECDTINGIFAEQLIPTYAWAHEYRFVDTMFGAENWTSFARLVTANETTELFVEQSTEIENEYSLNLVDTHFVATAGGFVDIPVLALNYIVSDKPFLVMMHTQQDNNQRSMDRAVVQISPSTEIVTLKLTSGSTYSLMLMLTGECVQAFEEDSAYYPNPLNLTAASIYVSSEGDMGLRATFHSPDQATKENMASASMVYDYSIYLNKSAAGCTGLSAYVLGYEESSAIFGSPAAWTVYCPIEHYFDRAVLECILITINETNCTNYIYGETPDNSSNCPINTTTAPNTTESLTTINSTEETTVPEFTTETVDFTTTENITNSENTTMPSEHQTPTEVTTQSPKDSTGTGTVNEPTTAGSTQNNKEPIGSTTYSKITTSTPPTMTRSPTQAPSGVHKMCACSCRVVHQGTPQEILARAVKEAENIVTNLTVVKSELSKTRRLLESTMDEEPVPTSIGLFGVIMLTFVTALIVLPDCINVSRFLCAKCSEKKTKTVS